MGWRTAIALYWLLFSSLWLCHVFVILWLHGEYLVTEPNKFVAWVEIVLTVGVALLALERLIVLRES